MEYAQETPWVFFYVMFYLKSPTKISKNFFLFSFFFFFFKLERNLDCISAPLIILSSSEIKGLGLKMNQSWAKHSKVGPPSS